MARQDLSGDQLADPPYKIRLEPGAIRALRKLPDDAFEQCNTDIDQLGYYPRSHRARRLQGQTGFRLTVTVRSGKYRVIYEIDDAAREIRVTKVGPRSNGYGRLLR